MNADDELLSIGEAAKLLRASPPTVRKLIDRQELDGQVVRGRARSKYVTSRIAVDDYLRREGHFPHHRPTVHSRLRFLEGRIDELTKSPRPGNDAGTLREVIRAQSAVIERLNQALAHQDRAAEHLREAEEARADAASAIHEAEEAQRSIIALYGIPDDASSLLDP